MKVAAPPEVSEASTLLDEDRRPLDPWDRYRALNAAMDEAYELIDLNNREGRFALILMSGLNAAVLVAGTRNDIASLLMAETRPIAIALFLIYVVIALYYTLRAVDALRPGHFRPRLGDWPKDRSDHPKGVRYFEDVIARDAEGYWQACRSTASASRTTSSASRCAGCTTACA
jgi:hypothetical protein